MIKKFFNQPIFYIIVSVFFALVLFFLAKSTAYNASGTQLSRVTETYSHTIESVPIDIKYDTEKYFISGYSYEAEVYLTSTNRIKLDSEINEDTRRFKVVADLSNVKAGTANAKLKVVGLPRDVNATVNPKSVAITIGKKAKKTFKVKSTIPPEQVADGYKIENIETGISEVTVTSNESTLQQIDHVEAVLASDKVLSSDYSGTVNLQAVSSDGTILPSIVDPAKTQLKVSVKKLTKEVPINLSVTGVLSDNLINIGYKLSQETVTVSGTQEELDAIDSVKGTVDITGVSKDVSKTVSLSASNVTIIPQTVTVKLTATKK
ncbi:YbbR-like domain-containing protein [Streptococcus halotolerans]|uniref:CdaR family protein n=1 Tax=Streptococcus halotolerans TaxID=1814128 RepID=UPI0007871855|nr:CdaR family protein [Streptococcus halotolerans]